MSKKKDEVVTLKVIVNLEDVMFEPKADSEMYTMIMPTGWGFKVQREVTEKEKKEIEKEIKKLIAEGVKNNEDD